MLRPFTIDRAADLFGTGGADGAVIFVEAQAGLFERQVERLKERPDFGFAVLHHAFVDHAVNAAGQHCVDMREIPDIVGIIAAHIV